MKSGNFSLYNTGRDVFPKIKPKEQCRTACMDELMLMFPCDESYRNSAAKINRVLWRDEEDGIKSRTLDAIVVREGETLQKCLLEKTQAILAAKGFDELGKPLVGTIVVVDCERIGLPQGKPTNATNKDDVEENPSMEEVHQVVPSTMDANQSVSSDHFREPITLAAPIRQSHEKVKVAVVNYNKDKSLEKQIDAARVQELYEDSQNVVNVSVDDVQVVKQKEKDRQKGSPRKENKEWAKNTIIHIVYKQSSYLLNGKGIIGTLIFLTAFMLNNNIADSGNLVFFVDGARDLQNAIVDMYGWRGYKLILDWFHLEKKCKEFLSMIVKGKFVKAVVLTTLLSYLWLGEVDKAIEYLRNIDKNSIKNEKKLNELIGYFERNRNNIPCYALRKELGLKTSSNSVEKANDNIVAKRQKHNGTSWSKCGSVSLASVTTMFKNKEQDNWIKRRTFRFKFQESKIAV